MSMGGQEQGELVKEKGTLMQLWIKLKNSIFDVLFVVLDKVSSEGGEVTLMSIVYESGIDYIQMMQFPFNFTIIMVWNGGETLNNIFNFLTGVLQINNLMPSLNFNAFLICLYLLIFMIILVILDIVYVSYSFTKKKFRFTLPLVLLAQIVPLFVTFLFIPIMEFLTNVINCSASPNDPSVQVMQYFPTIECFTGMHLIHASITLFFTSIFVFISTIVAMTLFEPRMTSSSILARKSSQGEVIFIINKVVCQFFFSFTPFDQTWIYIALMFFPALWLFYFYEFNNPFYNKKVGKLYRIFSAYFFWTVLMLSFSQVLLLLNFNFEGAMVIWVCGLPFIGFNIGYESRSNIDNLFSSNMKFKTGEELEAHLMYVLLLLNERKKDENSNMLLVGYIEKHIETCVEEDCPIKIKKPKKEEILSQMEENCRLLVVQLERMYKQGIKKFPGCTKLHISFAFFYMEQLHLNARAYEQFVKAEAASPGFIEEFIIYRFKKIIKEKLQESKEEESDLIEIIRFDNHVSLCEEAMLLSAKLHKQFWSQLVEETPALDKLNDTGSRIISVVNSVKSNYAEVSKINSHSPEITHNYGVYSMFISQNIHAGKRALTQARRAYFEKKAKGELLTANNSAAEMDGSHSLVVSAAQASMGKILSVSDHFIEMSGYLKEEITEKSIDKLLPQIMTYYHEYAMNQWLTDGTRLYMSHEKNGYFRTVHRGFVKQKNGFIVPIRYKVVYSVFEEKFYVHISNEKEFSENLEFRMYIITDNRGVIKEISSLGFAYFHFSKENLASSERFIDELGITLNEEIYAEEGLLLNIPKQRQHTNAPEGTEDQDPPVSGQVEADDQFFVRGERVWMPAEEEEEEEESHHHKDGKVEIGSIFCLERLLREKAQPKEVKLDSLNFFGGEILNFYEMGEEDEEAPLVDSRIDEEHPSRLKTVVNELIEADKEAMKEKSFQKYAGRIKTYRLVRGELKRVVEEWGEEDSEYDEFGEENLELSLFETEKLRNPVFVEKIKNAINTNIDHAEVTCLKLLFSVFLVALFTLSIANYVQVGGELDRLAGYTETNMGWVSDQFYINNLIHLAFNSSDEPNRTAAYLNNSQTAQDYTITFDPPVLVNMSNYNGEVSEVSLRTALTWMQGYILNFFNGDSLVFNDTSLLFYNYYTSVYPALEQYALRVQPAFTPTLAIFSLLLLISLVVVAVWIYYIMIIDQKCSDIILWFLDIPIPYVTYLQANCNTFIKTHTPVKELIDRGINFHDKNLYLEEFKAAEQEDEFSEENKSRKIMIARYKKKTLLSRCNCYYLSTLWLLLYASLLTSALLAVLSQQVAFFTFINAQWAMTARQLIWSSTIPNNLRLTQQLGLAQVGSVDLNHFQDYLQSQFLNPVSKHELASTYQALIAYGTEIASLYVLYFEDDICELPRYDTEELTNLCKNYLKSKLEGGIQSVFQYYATLERWRYRQIEHVQYDYINVFLFELFSLWRTTTEGKLKSAGNMITVLLVLYLVVSAFGFLLLWVLYLRKLNVRLNQTIQMLNMIPIRMLPKSRRDIRDFFAWIIRQANRAHAHRN